MTTTSEMHCRICGYEWDVPPWGDSGRLASFELCPCCDVETGYEDNNPTAARAYRSEWLARGAPWSADDVEPDGLSTEERLTRVPAAFR